MTIDLKFEFLDAAEPDLNKLLIEQFAMALLTGKEEAVETLKCSIEALKLQVSHTCLTATTDDSEIDAVMIMFRVKRQASLVARFSLRYKATRDDDSASLMGLTVPEMLPEEPDPCE